MIIIAKRSPKKNPAVTNNVGSTGSTASGSVLGVPDDAVRDVVKKHNAKRAKLIEETEQNNVEEIEQSEMNPSDNVVPAKQTKPTVSDNVRPAQPTDLTMSDKPKPAKKKCGSKSASIAANNTATPNEISQMMSNVLYWYGRDIVRSDDECADRLNEFFQHMTDTGEIPTVEKMCLALGTIRSTVWNWEQGVGCSSVRMDMIKKAKEMLAAMDAELVSKGKIPQVTYIFRAKNFFGMKDQADIVVTPAQPLGAEGSAADLQKRIGEGVVIDSTGTVSDQD